MHSRSLVSLHPRHVAPNGLQMLIPGMLRGARRSMTALPTGLSLDFFLPPPSRPWGGDKTQELFGPAQRGLVNSSFMGGHLDKQPLYLIICPHC